MFPLPFSRQDFQKVLKLKNDICVNLCMVYDLFLAPSLVVYDNACSLHTYCLLRDPHRFKYTRFLVDRFHWSNHTG